MNRKTVKNPIYRVFAAVSIALPMGAGLATAQDVDFEKNLLPVLEMKCMKCHRATYKDPKTGRTKKPKGDLRLDTPKLMVKGGESEKPAITPGKPDKSEALARVTLEEDHDDFMPSKGDALTKKEVELLKKWIEGGAKVGKWKGTEFQPDGKKVEK
jgi:hypothetical protein